MSPKPMNQPPSRALLALLMLSLSVVALPLPAHADEAAGGDGFVWRAERAGRTIFLAGALHYLAPGDHPLPEPFLRAFHASDILYFEVQPAEWSQPANARRLASQGRFPARGGTLWTTLPSEDARKFRAALGEVGGDPDDFSRLRPWRASLDFQNLMFRKLGLDGKHGVDAYLATMARKHGKITRSLESAKQQIKALADLPAAEERALLMEAVAALPTLARDMRELREAWREGDVARMTKVCEDAYAGNRERESAVLGKRNLEWVEYIQRMAMQTNSTSMVIVGVNHLVVKNHNLLEELRKKGFAISRVRARR